MIESMQKIYFGLSFLMVLFMQSCLNSDDDVDQITIEATGIDSVRIPEVGRFGQANEITMYFTYEDSCHDYWGVDYQINMNERTVVGYSQEIQNINCSQEVRVDSGKINFNPGEIGTYQFRFWKGLDAEGQNEYILKEIEIVLGNE